MADLLRMDFINSLPQLFVNTGGGEQWWWPVHDIDVETGLLRMDVCGLLQVERFGSVLRIKDADGVEYDTETFYEDYVP